MLHRRVVGKRRAFLDLVVVEHRDTDPCHARPGETNGVLGRPTALRPMSRSSSIEADSRPARGSRLPGRERPRAAVLRSGLSWSPPRRARDLANIHRRRQSGAGAVHGEERWIGTTTRTT